MNQSFINLNNINKNVEAEHKLTIENVEMFMRINEQKLIQYMDDNGIILEDTTLDGKNKLNQVKEYIKKLNNTNSFKIDKNIWVGIGIVALSVLVYGIYKYVKNNELDKNPNNIKEAKIKGEQSALIALRQGIKLCTKEKNPDNCRKKYYKVIEKHKKRIRKLTGWKKDNAK